MRICISCFLQSALCTEYRAFYTSPRIHHWLDEEKKPISSTLSFMNKHPANHQELNDINILLNNEYTKHCTGIYISDVFAYIWRHIGIYLCSSNSFEYKRYYSSLQLLRRCLLRCRHLETSSDLSLRRESLSGNSHINSFSTRQSPHFLVLLLYPAALLEIDHLME